MKTNIAILGVLLLAAPLLSQQAPPHKEPQMMGGKFQWFTLRETPKTIQQVLGPPAMVAESGANWIAWQFRLADDVGHEDFSHQLLLERGSGRLLSVTRNYEAEYDVSRLFPAKDTKLHYFPNAQEPQMTIRVRPLPGGLVLTALGASGPTSQLVLLRSEFVPILFPWVNSPSLK